MHNIHISLLDTDGTNSKSLQLSTGKQVDITIHNVVKLCKIVKKRTQKQFLISTNLGHLELQSNYPLKNGLRSMSLLFCLHCEQPWESDRHIVV